jgi:hypothetical protein
MQIDKKYYFIFFVALLILSIHFKYQQVLFYYPQSADIWRQADCASFAYNYYQHGMHFFEPEVHNMLSGTGKAVGECPLIYYCVAILYKLFGPHIFIFRLFNLIIFYLGLTALFRLTYRLTNDIFIAIITPLLLFSSPLILFYANNFLSDVPSLSFVFMALNRLLHYKESGRLKDFWISLLFFTLAALLKANAVIALVAIGSLFFIEWSGWNVRERSLLFKHNMINAFGFFLSLLLIVGWYHWAIHYNEINHSIFLGTKSWPGWPLWEVSEGDFSSSLVTFFYNLKDLFTLPLSAMFFFLVPFLMFNLGRLSFFQKGFFLFLLLGVCMFFLFFFVGFREQGYYYINLMLLPVCCFIFSAFCMKERFPVVFYSRAFKGMVIALLLVTVYNGKASTKVFYHNGWKHVQLNPDFYDAGLIPYERSLGIKAEDVVLSVPDKTPNASLYQLNTKGWSNYGFPDGQLDIAGIESRINEGCKYLVVNGESFAGDSVLFPYMGSLLGSFKSIRFYNLNSTARRVTLQTNDSTYVNIDIDHRLKLFGEQVELFITDLGNGYVSLHSYDWRYISTQTDENSPLVSNSKNIGEREKFILERTSDSTQVIKSKGNKYIRVKNGLFYCNGDKNNAQPFLIDYLKTL